jgi:general secretion pathway protein C
MLQQRFSTRLKFASGTGSPRPGDQRLAPTLISALLWLVVGLSAGYWVLRLLGGAPLQVPQGLPDVPFSSEPALVARALGELAPAPAQVEQAPPAAARLRLLGMVVQPGRQGAALIAVDDQPARPFRVGAPVLDEWVLQSVQGKVARLGREVRGATELELQLPDPIAQPIAEDGPTPPPANRPSLRPAARPSMDLSGGLPAMLRPAPAPADAAPAGAVTDAQPGASGACQGTVC